MNESLFRVEQIVSVWPWRSFRFYYLSTLVSETKIKKQSCYSYDSGKNLNENKPPTWQCLQKELVLSSCCCSSCQEKLYIWVNKEETSRHNYSFCHIYMPDVFHNILVSYTITPDTAGSESLMSCQASSIVITNKFPYNEVRRSLDLLWRNQDTLSGHIASPSLPDADKTIILKDHTN